MRRCRSWYRIHQLLQGPSAAACGTAGGPPGPVAAGHVVGRERLPGPGGGGAGRPRGQCPYAAPAAVRRSEGRCGAAGGLGNGPGTGRGGLLCPAAGLGPVLEGSVGAPLVLARLKHRFPRLRWPWTNAVYADSQLGTWVQAATDWTLAIVRHPQPGAGFQVLPRFREFLCCTG